MGAAGSHKRDLGLAEGAFLRRRLSLFLLFLAEVLQLVDALDQQEQDKRDADEGNDRRQKCTEVHIDVVDMKDDVAEVQITAGDQ